MSHEGSKSLIIRSKAKELELDVQSLVVELVHDQ